MKKWLACLLVFVLFPSLVFADAGTSAENGSENTSARTFFPSQRGSGLLPADSTIGQTAQPDSTAEHRLLSAALSSDYGFEWAEEYLDQSSRAAITSLYSENFSELLPAQNTVFSRTHSNGDGSVSISVHFLDAGTAAGFIITDGKIIAVKF